MLGDVCLFLPKHLEQIQDERHTDFFGVKLGECKKHELDAYIDVLWGEYFLNEYQKRQRRVHFDIFEVYEKQPFL